MMSNNKTSSTPSARPGVNESVRLIHRHLDPIATAPMISSANAQISSPSDIPARAVIRRLDEDKGPKRIEGTDTYNHPTQHHYQNAWQMNEDSSPKTDPSNESRQSFSAKRDFFEQRMKSSPSTYDSPPRQSPSTRKIITTITTTTEKPTSNAPETRRSSSNESPPTIDRLLEQAADLQKSNRKENSVTKDDSIQPILIERSEQYQVFLDSAQKEVRRTPSVSRVSIVPSPKTASATDLDLPQVQGDRLVDDHQAIQQLTRALQEHNVSTVNDYKRLPSYTNSILVKTTTTTTSTMPAHMVSNQRAKSVPEEFTVIDALLDNPVGTTDEKQNATLHTRLSKIIANLQNSEYVSLLTQSRKKTTATGSNQEKQSKKNKKKSENTNNEVINAIVNSPICPRMPNMCFVKYPPSSALSSSPSVTAQPDNNTPVFQGVDGKNKKETELGLAGVVQQRQLITPSDQSDSVPPRVVYRYLDEQGRVLKISSVPPSQLQEAVPQQQPTPSEPKSHSIIAPTPFSNQTRTKDQERSRPLFERNGRSSEQDPSKSPTVFAKDSSEIQPTRASQLEQKQSQTLRAIPVSIVPESSTRTAPQQTSPERSTNPPPSKIAWVPFAQSSDPYYTGNSGAGYDTDSTISEPSAVYRPYDYAPRPISHRYSDRALPSHDHYHHQRSPDVAYHYSSPTRAPGRPASGSRQISPEYGAGSSRNYIEIFRDGETKPSEVYSLPLNELLTSNHRHSRYDQYQTEKRRKHRTPYHQQSKSSSRYENTIPSAYSAEGQPPYPHTVGNSPNRDSPYFDDYLPPSKPFDYRPLRSKLQREYKITPSLLVDEWEQSSPPSARKTYEQQTSVSSPDDVFIKHPRSSKAGP